MRLEGKVAIITGAASGMGAEEARLFAREGASVVVADVNDADGMAVAREIEDTGGEATYARADVTSAESWQALVETAVEKYGGVDILVNNAGISSTAYADPLDMDGWNRIMDINATGVYLGTRAVIPVMQAAGGGSIVNISSIRGFVAGENGHPAYEASKGAVRIFTKATAVRYGPDGIRANSVHPGLHAADEVVQRGAGVQPRRLHQADAATQARGDDRGSERRPVPGVGRGVVRDRHGACDRRRVHGAVADGARYISPFAHVLMRWCAMARGCGTASSRLRPSSARSTSSRSNHRTSVISSLSM